jgi:hypothetical protein
MVSAPVGTGLMAWRLVPTILPTEMLAASGCQRTETDTRDLRSAVLLNDFRILADQPAR